MRLAELDAAQVMGFFCSSDKALRFIAEGALEGAGPVGFVGIEAFKICLNAGVASRENFWATWCSPCQEELPRLSKLAQSYNGKNVRFIAST